MNPINPKNWQYDFSAYLGRSAETDAELKQLRATLRSGLNQQIFERKETAWYRQAYVEAFLFMYDISFYDRESGRYRLDEILDDGEQAFGGYDIILLWQSYPRLGIDGRNQLDFYRDMPGGLPGLRALVDRAHDRGVRVFVNYNPWDVGTRREPGAKTSPDPRGYRPGFTDTGAPAIADAEALAGIIAAIGADGVFLDTMASYDPGFRAPLEAVNADIVFNPERVPPLEALGSVTGSWLQRTAVEPPKLLTIRWLEPRFSFRTINRDSLDQRELIHQAFFHGCGYVVWENIFGWWNPWSAKNRSLIRRCVRLLREHTSAFQDLAWQPYVSTLISGVYAHRWQDKDKVIHTLFNDSGEPAETAVLAMPAATEDGRAMRHYDLWHGVEIQPKAEEDTHLLTVSLGNSEAGCILSAPDGVKVDFHLPNQKDRKHQGNYINRERVALQDLKLKSVERSTPVASGEQPADMCYVSGRTYPMHVRHNNAAILEGACYGSLEHRQDKSHPVERIDLDEYWIDQTPVTNEDYRRFLEKTRYVPQDLTNFLRHWQRPENHAQEPWTWHIPSGKARHPVVWVDLDDARQYALWAGKRLPREAEWQCAAGFTVWPWGDRFDPSQCNSGTTDTTPVDQYPGGASSLGCLDMSGNTWEWTESERSDGHTRYAIIRGGSYLKIEGSKWYNASGAQPNDCHEKMLLMYPGLDRCSTIGFRCVKDVAD